jgi:hypothetical protein
MDLGHLKPRLDYLDIMFGSFTSLLGLLLEGMKDIDHSGRANGVDGPVSISVLIIDHLQHTPAAKSPEGLGTRMLLAVLCVVDRHPHDAAYLVWECRQVVSRRSDR